MIGDSDEIVKILEKGKIINVGYGFEIYEVIKDGEIYWSEFLNKDYTEADVALRETITEMSYEAFDDGRIVSAWVKKEN